MNTISIELIAEIKRNYKLRWTGTHGIIHWHRVYENGIKLSAQPEVNPKVLELFAIFHDSQRKNEHLDPGHGKRGATLAIKLRHMLPLDNNEFNLLTTACSLHTKAKNHEDITVQACFDADRLDLGRVNITPNPALLCTPLAKQQETIDWAYQRSRHIHELPEKPFGLNSDQEFASG